MLASIAALGGLVIVLLALPVDMRFRLRGIEAFTGRITVRWLFGLVRFGFNLPRPDSSKRRERKRKPATDAKNARHGSAAKVVAVLRQPEFRERVYRLVKDLVRAAHLQQLGLRVRLGLGDPADTGRLWALMGPISAAAQNLRNAEVRIDPDFVDAALEFDAQGRVVLYPLQFVALAASFALSPQAIRAWRTLRGDRG